MLNQKHFILRKCNMSEEKNLKYIKKKCNSGWVTQDLGIKTLKEIINVSNILHLKHFVKLLATFSTNWNENKNGALT